MADIKRLNYFTSQFLVEQDFKDEQAYFLDMRRRHNQFHHSWGVAGDGLQASKTADKSVSVSAGMAVDKQGREIVLLDAKPKDLSAFSPNADVYLSVKYQEVSDPADHYSAGGVDNYTRTTERPVVDASTTPPPPDGTVVVLAKISLDAGGNIGKIDNSIRKTVGSAIDPATDLSVRSLSVTGDANVGGNVGIGVPSPELKVDVGDRVRLRQGASGTAGLSLYQTAPAEDRAFIGMQDDNSVGFYGNKGGGWGLSMDVTNGNVGVHAAPSSNMGLYVDANANTFGLYVSGTSSYGLFVGGGASVYGLYVTGNAYTAGRATDQKIRVSTTLTDRVSTANSSAWVQIPGMGFTVVAGISAWFQIHAQMNGVGISGVNLSGGYFRLLVDGGQQDMTRHDFHNGGWEVRGVYLSKLVWLQAGTHTISVEWLPAPAGATLWCSFYGDSRQIQVIEL